eukprot:g2319.t1
MLVAAASQHEVRACSLHLDPSSDPQSSHPIFKNPHSYDDHVLSDTAGVSHSNSTSRYRQNRQPQRRILSTRFNHNGRVLVSGGDDASIVLCTTQGRGKCLGRLSLRDDKFNTVPSSSSTTQHAPHSVSGGSDAEQYLRALSISRIRSLAFSSGSRYLCSGCDRGSLCVWDLKKRSVVQAFTDHPTKFETTCVQFDHQDRIIASSSAFCIPSSNNLDLNLDEDAITNGNLRNAPILIHEMQFTPSMTTSTTTSQHDHHQPSQNHTLSGPSLRLTSSNGTLIGGASDIKFSPFNHSYVAAACHDGTVRLWDLEANKKGLPLTPLNKFGQYSQSTALIFSPLNAALLVATSAKTGQLSFFDIKSGKLVKKSMVRGGDNGGVNSDSNINKSYLHSLCFLENGYNILGGTGDGKLCLYDLRKSSAEPLAKISLTSDAIESVHAIVAPTLSHSSSSSSSKSAPVSKEPLSSPSSKDIIPRPPTTTSSTITTTAHTHESNTADTLTPTTREKIPQIPTSMTLSSTTEMQRDRVVMAENEEGKGSHGEENLHTSKSNLHTSKSNLHTGKTNLHTGKLGEEDMSQTAPDATGNAVNAMNLHDDNTTVSPSSSKLTNDSEAILLHVSKMLDEMQTNFTGTLQNFHLEMIRQFSMQSEQIAVLMEENQRLREIVERNISEQQANSGFFQ